MQNTDKQISNNKKITSFLVDDLPNTPTTIWIKSYVQLLIKQKNIYPFNE